MPDSERKKTASFIKEKNPEAEDSRMFSLLAQFIDTAQPNGTTNLEHYLRELSKIHENKNNGWTTEFDLRNVALLLYQRALLSQTKDNGWFLTENCKAIFKALKTDEANFKPLSKTTHVVGFFSSEKKEKTLPKKSRKNSPHSPF